MASAFTDYVLKFAILEILEQKCESYCMDDDTDRTYTAEELAEALSAKFDISPKEDLSHIPEVKLVEIDCD